MNVEDCDPPRQYFGKYRGRVLDNVDPLQMGRILVDVPAVPSAKLSFAMPCVPYAGPLIGMFVSPEIGSNVWVEFEGGDPNSPIWSGCFWSEGEIPEPAGLPGVAVFKTNTTTLILSEEEGITLEVLVPGLEDLMSVTFNASGIEVTVPPALIRLAPDSLEVVCGASTVTLSDAEGIAVAADGPVEVGSPDVNVDANVSVEGPVEVEGNVAVTGATELIGNVDVTGNMEVEAADIAFTCVAVEVNCAAMFELLAPGIVFTGAAEVNGDLLIDGQQPLVI